MSGTTRIVVIPLKKLIITICVIAILIIAAIFFIFSSQSEGSSTTNSDKIITNNSINNTSSDVSDNSDNKAEVTNNKESSYIKKSQNSSSKDSTATYSPGVYTSSLILNGNPIDIQVTVDANNINSIEMVNLSEDIQTMYPMLSSSFNEIKTAVINNGSAENVTYDSSNKYTANMLLTAIQNALNKAALKS